MQSFLAMLLTLRIGLVPSPVDGAILSIREEALAVARDVAARDTFVGREPARFQSLRSATLAPETRPAAQAWGGPPPIVRVLRKEDWRGMLAHTLNGNQKIANAATWLASAPLRLKINNEKIFLSITVRTP